MGGREIRVERCFFLFFFYQPSQHAVRSTSAGRRTGNILNALIMLIRALLARSTNAASFIASCFRRTCFIMVHVWHRHLSSSLMNVFSTIPHLRCSQQPACMLCKCWGMYHKVQGQSSYICSGGIINAPLTYLEFC